MLLRNN